MSDICAVIHSVGLSNSFTKVDISVKYLRARGPMAILMAGLEPDTIHLVGRWKSDTMISYLYTTEKSFTDGFSRPMFQHVRYTVIMTVHAGH